jgi:carbonic anhydrase
MHRAVIDILQRNEDHTDEFQSRFEDVQDTQRPDVVTVCCSDSRVLQDRIWGNVEPGNIFTCANIGNRVIQQTDTGPAVSGDVLYPLEHTGTETAVVVGHTGCGAVTAAYQHLTGEAAGGDPEPAGIAHCIDIISTRLSAGVELLPADLSDTEAINRLVEYNVDRQVEFLRESEDISDEVAIVGAVYDFQDIYSDSRGEAHVINIDGETDVETLRAAHPEVSSRINRRWMY